MNVEHLLTSTARITTVTDTGPPDQFGDPTQATVTRTFRCWLSQSQRAEQTVGTDLQLDTWWLYLEAAAAAVTGYDRATVDGIVFELDGPPWPALNPRTRQVTHVECTVKRSR